MFQIVLAVLKIIGILILLLLGLLLLAVLAVVLVPVRYRGKGSYQNRPTGFLRVTWLLHTVSFLVSYGAETGLVFKVRILGLPLSAFSRKKSRKKTGRQQSKSPPEPHIPLAEPPLAQLPLSAEDEEPLSAQELTGPEEDASHQTDRPGKGNRLIALFKNVIRKIKALWHRIRFFFSSLPKKTEKIRQLWATFLQPENQKTLRLVLSQGKRLIRHLMPTKIRGSVVFGFEDPYTTGQILSYAGLLYPCYHDKMKLYPVFDRQVLEGQISLKGRIRLGSILMCVLRIYMDQNFRRLYKKWMEQ